nr:hypothetical protein [Escherichia coli]
MAMKYLGLPAHQYMMKIDSLWPLANRLDIPYHHRAVLAMTYDRMYVKQEHFALAADCIRKYLTDFPADDKYVNHWPRIAEIFESSPECPAIGLWLTSVCENPFLGEWDEEIEDYKQPDWSRYWSLFDDLDASESGVA